MQEMIMEVLIEKDDITWQSIIHNLVKSGEIDPWDVNITTLTQKYIKILKTLKEMDFRISGKVVLAAALLLRIKSTKLLDDDINEFDRMLAETEEMSEEDFYYDLENPEGANIIEGEKERYKLMPRTPQPRKRKVSVYDLIGALEKAFTVKQRRIIRNAPAPHMRIPTKTSDMTYVIRTVYKEIVTHFKNKKKKLTFTDLLPSETKLDKVYTFIPLLHLSNQRRIDMFQKEHFGEIDIKLLKNVRIQEVDEELGLA